MIEFAKGLSLGLLLGVLFLGGYLQYLNPGMKWTGKK